MLDECIEQLKKGSCISEGDLKRLCYIVKNILLEEANVQAVKAPVTVRETFSLSLQRIIMLTFLFYDYNCYLFILATPRSSLYASFQDMWRHSRAVLRLA